MKHAASKEKPARETTKIERTITVKDSKKIAETAAILPFGKTKTKAAEKSQSKVQKINPKEKAAKNAAVVSKTKTTAAKSAPILSGKEDDGKNDGKKKILAVPVEKNAVKTKKAAPVVIVAKSKVEKKKIELTISLPENRKMKAATVSAVSVQKAEPRIKETETIAPAAKARTEIQKIKSAVNVGKINAALKMIEEARIKAAKTEKKEKKRSAVNALKTIIVEAKSETVSLQTKIKPKNVKQIGAAVFRGRKNRYDFQVYPLDFEFENVSAIYVISKRKTDHKKRAHHALVCIGQTDSILSELEKHTKSKCVKKHEANVISILPERSEKKRLKIEEDLKAAHQIVCNIV